MTDDNQRILHGEICKKYRAFLSEERAGAPQAVTFSQGDYNVLIKSLPSLVAAQAAELVKAGQIIASLQTRIEALEGKFERRLELVREAAMTARNIMTDGETIHLADAPDEATAAAGEHAEAAAGHA